MSESAQGSHQEVEGEPPVAMPDEDEEDLFSIAETEPDLTSVRNYYQRVEEWEDRPLARQWLALTDPFFELAYGKHAHHFDAGVIFVIVVAGFMVGVQTYPEFTCPASFDDVDDDALVSDCENRGWGGGSTISSAVCLHSVCFFFGAP